MSTIGQMNTRNWQVMGEAFELESPRYKVMDYLGSGAYGVVCAVQDNSDNAIVAIKKCKKIFQSRTLAKRTLREVRLLRHFNHENIVKLRTLLPPTNPFDFTELYLVFELMETDLAQVIRSPQSLKDQHVQYFAYQLIRALQYLHSENIVHRDIKPRNILVNSNCLLKLADFGLARIYKPGNDDTIVAITDYVTTRWYRAPEILVGWPCYTTAVDMWAVGCVISELIHRSPLFPGSDAMKQIEIICKVLGKPSDSFIEKSKKQQFKTYMSCISPISPESDANGLLEIDPIKRCTATMALSHTYISSIAEYVGKESSNMDVDCALLHIPPEEFAFEDQKLSMEDLRREILIDISYHNPYNNWAGSFQLDRPSPHTYMREPTSFTPFMENKSVSSGAMQQIKSPAQVYQIQRQERDRERTVTAAQEDQ
eukprot:gene23690-30722_t